jgi:hypothetical protein
MLKPRDNGNGYKFVSLGRWTPGHNPNRYIHRLVAESFVPNPNGYTEVDHKFNRRDLNYAWLLRWVSRSENMRNKGADRNGDIEYIQELPAGSVPVESYKGHRFEGLFTHEGSWYRFNGVRFQKLRLNLRGGTYYVSTVDTDGATYEINTAQYRISIGDVPTTRERPRNPDSVLPDGAVEVGEFNGWIFDKYYWHGGLFYKDTGTEYKAIHPRAMTGSNWMYVQLFDVVGTPHNVGINKYRRTIGEII